VEVPAAIEAHLRGDDVADLRYEVMYLLDAADDTVGAFKAAWAAVGDSIVVVGGDGLWNCHIHTNDIGAAVEAGIDAGRPRNIRVTDLFEQVHELHPHAADGEHNWVEAARDAGHAAATLPAVTTAVVAVAVGDGVRRLFTSLGVQQVVAGGQSMNPSTAQILEAVEQCAADAIVVLPNNKNIVPVARQVDGLTDRTVAVVASTSVVEGLTALVAYDPSATLDANVDAMGAAVERVRTGEVTRAIRDSVGECGPIKEGDWIALDASGICAAVDSPAAAVEALLGRLVDDDSEIVTVLVGADAPAGDTTRIREHLELAYPHVEFEFHDGGQPLYPYLLGVE
jgi:dihydroxyacetone kinase-like predicted kinase